jgi:hypothetical protein
MSTSSSAYVHGTTPSGAPGSNGFGQGAFTQGGFSVNYLIGIVNNATISATNKIQILQSRGSAISIADMFDMQMLMNHLQQLSEMSTNVVSTANSAISSMARNVKG